MSTIKASCPTCGEVEMTERDVRLMVCSHAPLSYYAFDCSGCLDEIRKPADEHVVSLLMSGGVEVTVWEVPEEALEPKTGPAIGYDDLLDLVTALAGMDTVPDAMYGPAGGDPSVVLPAPDRAATGTAQ